MREAQIERQMSSPGKIRIGGIQHYEDALPELRTHDVTALLIDWRAGDAGAVERLIPLVHGELRRIAKRHMAGERQDHVLQATALVNEVYLRLIDIRRVQWQDRAHFFAVAARLMRRVLVDFARSEKNQKRGGALHRITFDQNLPIAGDTPDDVIAIDEALQRLSAEYERKAQVVELRFFGGLSVEETAEVLKISEETVMPGLEVRERTGCYANCRVGSDADRAGAGRRDMERTASRTSITGPRRNG
jgi:RNA polymerase sigma factor (TIGR02999 family)